MDNVRFPSAGHVVSWAGLCPLLDEGAAKRRSVRVGHGDALVEDVAGPGRVGGGAEARQPSVPISAPEGPARSEEGDRAVAASLLTVANYMLRDGKDHDDLGGRYLADRDKHRIAQSLVRRQHDLGVEVEAKAA